MGHRSDVLHGRPRGRADAGTAGSGKPRCRSAQGSRARWSALGNPDPAHHHRAHERASPHSRARAVSLSGADARRRVAGPNARSHRAGPDGADANHCTHPVPASDCDCHSGAHPDPAAGPGSDAFGAHPDRGTDSRPAAALGAARDCRPDPDPDSDTDTDSEPDADANADADTDTDSEPDADADADSDSDPRGVADLDPNSQETIRGGAEVLGPPLTSRKLSRTPPASVCVLDLRVP